MKTNRIEWEEQRSDWRGACEIYYVIAERDENEEMGWTFCERSSWDICWIPIVPTLNRVALAMTFEAEDLPWHACGGASGMGREGTRRPTRSARGETSGRVRKRCRPALPETAQSHGATLNRRMGHASPIETKGLKSENLTVGSKAIASQNDSDDPEVEASDEDIQPPPSFTSAAFVCQDLVSALSLT
jgi:hypothetical protein